jgi:hypothetical protein
MRKRVSLPLPVLVLVIVAALALGTVGPATAGSVTARSAKKIATKVIRKKAPGLSVAHATTADTATTAISATSATTATSAATATNSTQLDGKPPAAYLDRVAHANLTASLGLPDTVETQIVGPTIIVVPQGVGFIHVTAHAGFSGGSTNLRMWPSLDGLCAVNSGDDYDHSGFGNTTNQTTISLDYLAAVAPGNHNVRLCVFAATAGASATIRSLTIETIASDFNG